MKNEMLEKLNLCRDIVISNIQDVNCPVYWDGKVREVPAKEQYDIIKEWCRNRVKNIQWSHHDRKGNLGYTTYGLKHTCERDLKSYVANNWIKMALIDIGIEVTNVDNVDSDSNRLLYKGPIDIEDILVNSENFIYRRPKDFEYGKISTAILQWKTDKNTNKLREIKYCDGNYE